MLLSNTIKQIGHCCRYGIANTTTCPKIYYLKSFHLDILSLNVAIILYLLQINYSKIRKLILLSAQYLHKVIYVVHKIILQTTIQPKHVLQYKKNSPQAIINQYWNVLSLFITKSHPHTQWKRE